MTTNRKLEDTRMKIVIINGSARKGNTLAAINAFIKGASEKNKIEIIEPDKLNIAPCKGCGVCQCSKGCVDKFLRGITSRDDDFYRRMCDFPQSWSAPNHTGDATLPLRWLPPATLLCTCHLGTPCVASCSQPTSFIKYAIFSIANEV